MEQPRVLVAITSYNREKSLWALVDKLLEYENCKIIIFDDLTPNIDKSRLGGRVTMHQPDEHCGKADQVHTHSAIGDGGSSITVGEGEINIELSDTTTHSGGEVDINISKLPNLQRAINDPDTTPTLNSNNLVTSGGVRVAIEEKFQGIVPDITGIGDGDSMNLDTLEMIPPSVRRFIIKNTGSSAIPFRDMFYSENLPVHISGDDTLEIGVGEYVMVSVFRENSSEHEHINCYFVLFEGIFEE